MDAKEIFHEAKGIVESTASVLPSKRAKLTGAVAVEVIRRYLIKSGVQISPRDVFIKGFPTEFDTLVVRSTANPVCGIIYEPTDFAAVLEIKNSGVYSADVLPRLRKVFGSVKENHPHIRCIFLTLCENPKFRHKMTNETLGSPAFTLNWWTDYKKQDVYAGQGWHDVVACLQGAFESLADPSLGGVVGPSDGPASDKK